MPTSAPPKPPYLYSMMPSARAVQAEVEGEAAPVAVGQRADGVLADLRRVGAAGGVAAVEDELVAGRVGVAVVAALIDAEQPVASAC